MALAGCTVGLPGLSSAVAAVPPPAPAAFARANCTWIGSVPYRELLMTDAHAAIDEMARFGVNVIHRLPSYGTGGISAKASRDIFAYARTKGIRAFVVPTTAVYDRATRPDGISPTNWPCSTLCRPWQDTYYCWADDKLVEAAAERCADELADIGAEDAIVMLHPYDGGGLDDPEYWSKRCAKCRARWKDDERWRAAANICNIWSRVLRRRCPKALLGSCIYHYALSNLERPVAERDEKWQRNFYDFWRHMDESVEDPSFAFDSWIYRAGLSNEVRRLVKRRPIVQMDTYPTYAGVFSSSARHAGAGIDRTEPSTFVPYGLGIPFSWETVFFTAACVSDPSLPGCDPYSGHDYYNPFTDHTGPKASVEGVLRPICRRFWGEAIAPDMEAFLLSGVLPLYIDNPQKTVRRWNKILRDPTFDEVTGVSVGSKAFGGLSPVMDTPERMRAQVAKAEAALAILRRIAANPAAKSLGPVQRDTLAFRLKAAPYWLASARTQANRREIAALEKAGRKDEAAERRKLAEAEFARDFAEAEKGGAYKGWETTRAFFEKEAAGKPGGPAFKRPRSR